MSVAAAPPSSHGPAPASAGARLEGVSTGARPFHCTYAEYLALEDESSTRHEFIGGEVSPIAGGTPDHAALAMAVGGILRGLLPSGCRPYSSDLRVRIASSGLTTYPDVSVVCGRTLRAPDDPLAVTNPVLLVEVTSSSTEDYDRGEKLRHYKLLPSVREVAIVSHRQPRITVHRRDDDGQWTATEAGPGEEVLLVGCTLRVDDVYRDALEDPA